MRQDKNVYALGHEKISKLLLDYSLPAIIASTASSLYNIIDRMFIGQGVGAYAISGLALTFPIMNLGVAFGTLVGAGAASIVSLRLGEKREDEARHTLGNALILNIIIGLFFSFIVLFFLDDILRLFGASERTLPYARDFLTIIVAGNVLTHVFFGLNGIMRASGHPRKAMVTTLLTVGCNLILAPIFIFVFRWGIRGAAAATLLAQAIGTCWVLAHFLNKKTFLRFTPACFRLQRHIITGIFSIGLSPFFIHACTCFVTIIMNWQLKKYGGDFAVGAFGIINSITGLIVMLVFGFTQGMQPIVGYNYGARQYSRVTETLKITIGFATGVMCVGFLLAMLFPAGLASLFTSNALLIHKTVYGIRLYLIMLPVVGFQIVASNFFQNIGKSFIAILLSLSRQVLFLIPFLLILPTLFGYKGVWLAQPTADFCAATVTILTLFIFYKKYFKKL